ncbi:hypothetical protein WM40_09265 [Robbsia andropogonis]|uniref:Uncharacterized protein n=1 Tax=Robbsia andropogonis TaxID=28092 RepID=A0A0F5K145_9BURK|nr:hypothetical protein WM40_09265 [Robbsia andropogonis]
MRTREPRTRHCTLAVPPTTAIQRIHDDRLASPPSARCADAGFQRARRCLANTGGARRASARVYPGAGRRRRQYPTVRSATIRATGDKRPRGDSASLAQRRYRTRFGRGDARTIV